MKLLIISGFLGAGKTTLIKHMAEKCDQPFAVLENEYGEIGVDGDDLKEKKLNVYELAEGCICCSMKGNFTSSLLTIQGALNPDYLVVEPSGVGMLGAIIKNVQPLEKFDIHLLPPITLVDAAAWAMGIGEFGPYYEDQIKNASLLIVTKNDKLSPAQHQQLRQWLTTLNPKAQIVEQDYRLMDPKWFHNLFHQQWDPSTTSTPTVGIQRPTQLTLTHITVPTAEHCVEVLQRTLQKEFGNVLRLKGFAPIQGQWGHFDVAADRWGLEPCEPHEPSRVILIGKDLDKAKLQQVWQAKELTEQDATN